MSRIKNCPICGLRTTRRICYECEMAGRKKECYICGQVVSLRSELCAQCRQKKISECRLSPRELIIQHIGGKCFICGHKKGLELHHEIPISQGGVDRISNLVCVCGSCHKKIHNGEFKRALKKMFEIS